MRCNRCGYAVPEWLWIGDDHPLIVENGKPQFIREDVDLDRIKITAISTVRLTMCKDVNKSAGSDFIDIGPECFAGKDELVISWKGSNYYKACGMLVTGRLDGQSTTCVKRVNHKNVCEDYDGETRYNGVLGAHDGDSRG